MKHSDNGSILNDNGRLNQLDIDLRQEADEFLAKSGLKDIISNAGYIAVGSYKTRTMVWRDLDFERIADHPNWQDHWTVGNVLAKTGWVWRLSCVDAYRDQINTGDCGHYWGLRASNPGGGPVWKLDLWTARIEEYALEKRALWDSLITDESRIKILRIKEAMCMRPEYRKTLLSVHIYEAVLENNIEEIEGFLNWWQRTHQGGGVS